MSLGNHLFDARKKKGLSQEEVAEKLGVSRQTISKWETDETLPDIRQAKRLAVLYGLSLDELITFDLDIREIQEAIDRTSEEVTDKIDWTKAWSKKYPVLSRYQKEVDTTCYAAELDRLLKSLEKGYGYNELDSFLVLKDILASVWKGRKENGLHIVRK
ncbi:MAG: helix-turn-helix transcriptional regulator [Lachnospiraceae bacterium]|nr:helix-turn-helix transcriptional regulator [Lachnospiraceae bacterium]